MNFQYMIDNAPKEDIGCHNTDDVSEILETLAKNSQRMSAERKQATASETTHNYDMTQQLAELVR